MENTAPKVAIEGASLVLLAKNLEQTVQFYSGIGFTHEVIGSKVKHHHVSRDHLTFILVEAAREDEVKPISSCYEEQYFDVYWYSNAVDLLAQEMTEKNITIVREPHYTEHWSEFTFRDPNGYQITVGGGVGNRERVSG
ncbi:VOC family protein [Paenibacillus sp. GYB003]|uniref:VOC family protein n=1 Tax=Paenibacillus sp. GYB003 TaxID=2994392 RepID=UPI002F96D10A